MKRIISLLLSLTMLLSVTGVLSLTESGTITALAEQYTNWSAWSTTPAYASSTRQVETRQVIASYDLEGYCCGNSSGTRCYLKYMQNGYSLRLHYEKITKSKGEVDTWQQYAQGSYYNYASNVAGYIIGPGTAYIEPYNHIPYFIVGTNYETQYRYRDIITNISTCTVTVSPTSYYYDGKEKKPSVTVKNNGKTLTQGKDYTVTYKNNIQPGTATVTVKGTGSYNGTVTKNFTIKKKYTYPCITGFNNKTNGITIKWSAFQGASKYRVLVMTSNGWKKVIVTAALSYTYTPVKSGQSYTFTICALKADGKTRIGDYNKKGWKTTFYAAPKITKLTNENKGIRVQWSKVKGAKKYRVYVKENKKWKGIGNSTTNSILFRGAKSGVKYTFTVRCVSSDGKSCLSAYYAGKTKLYVAAPVAIRVSYHNSGHLIRWKKVPGAVKYCILIKVDGKWKVLGYTTKTKFINKQTTLGKNCTYTVRCVTKNGKTYTSGYNTKGKSFKTLSAPKSISVSRTSTSVVVSWKHVKGAKRYRVYFRSKNPEIEGSKGWTDWYEIGEATHYKGEKEVYYYHSPNGGYIYQYFVQCITDEGSKQSPNSKASKGIRFCKAPRVYQGCVGSGFLRFYWYNTTGADQYIIYLKDSNTGKFKKIATTRDNVYYYYTSDTYGEHVFAIRAADSKGKIMSEYRTVILDYTGYNLRFYTY